jgi:hypothetical protein
VAGCSSWRVQESYRRIEVGRMAAEEAGRLMPKPVQAGPAGLVFYKEQGFGLEERQDALVVVLAAPGQVQAKLRVGVVSQRWGRRVRRNAELEAELASPPGVTARAGPVAELEAVLEALGQRPFDRLAVQGQGLAAAAVLRVLEAMPGVQTKQSLQQRYAGQLDRIGPDGDYQISKGSNKTYRIVYRATRWSG